MSVSYLFPPVSELRVDHHPQPAAAAGGGAAAPGDRSPAVRAAVSPRHLHVHACAQGLAAAAGSQGEGRAPGRLVADGSCGLRNSFSSCFFFIFFLFCLALFLIHGFGCLPVRWGSREHYGERQQRFDSTTATAAATTTAQLRRSPAEELSSYVRHQLQLSDSHHLLLARRRRGPGPGQQQQLRTSDPPPPSPRPGPVRQPQPPQPPPPPPDRNSLGEASESRRTCRSQRFRATTTTTTTSTSTVVAVASRRLRRRGSLSART